MLANPAVPATEQQPKRRRVTLACISCRARKSRCSGQRPKCSTCTELGLTCQYVSSGQTDQTVVVGKEHFQTIEERLHHLESLLDQGRASSKRSWSDVDTPDIDNQPALTPNLVSTSDGPLTGSIGSDDPTDGMGHFVIAHEEHRAYFGPSSNIAFASELSRTLKRLSRSRGEFSPGSKQTTLRDFHIARVSRPSSPMSQSATWAPNNHQQDAATSSIFYLPPDQETSVLIDQYFGNTGLLFPYIHEDTFRESYAQLRQNSAGTRRTWLGVLNMVLAMATHTTTLPMGKVDKRQAQSEAFYARADGLCSQHVMNGASLEIGQLLVFLSICPGHELFDAIVRDIDRKTVQYLLLVSQYMQGTRSSIQTWATHGLAVKVALQLGLHSVEASRRFSPVEREVRKRTWFGCIVLDRSLSMTFGRPASIPGHYSRLELPAYFDLIETRERPAEARQRCRNSTDFFVATIRLYSIMGNAIDLLYDGNLGSEDKILNYELITRVLRMRHSLEEWIEQLPAHMRLIRAENCAAELGKDPTNDRFRTILTLRYHNLQVLIHRAVLLRLCDYQDQNILALQDIAWSTEQITIESATEIINIVRFVVEAGLVQQGLLGAWWFTLYYMFDAALILFTILLVKRFSSIKLYPPTTLDSIKEVFLSCIEPLRRLDEGNRTVDKCCRCLQALSEVWNSIEINNEESLAQDIPLLTQPRDYNYHHDNSVVGQEFADQSLSFLDFDLMANELFDVTDGLVPGWGVQ
ncbi:putative transcriptional regulatory protein [Penicillium chrysogenum]|uniref:Putative transcriptional regulatory protein n=1 Tax=Penicillium chrysogenum TaxID=5076 RepID=A0A167SMG9_PENCH|nr:uncharacterized protein N7525_008696 [Penicillium rubens]KAJ5830443.1 hypothetical protein N7525_008696 [Penicillium rubens]KAJ5854024.1 hypothetical protein N7534_006567 [Penicillium rubens]KZN87353.1 putative transcriptional regulatory protein [Penicillium chrysogenum]